MREAVVSMVWTVFVALVIWAMLCFLGVIPPERDGLQWVRDRCAPSEPLHG